MPLIRRIPKRGFNNAEFRTEFEIVNVGDLNVFRAGSSVTPETLVEAGLIDSAKSNVKILGSGKLEKKLTVQARQFSASAKAAIEAAGGTCEVVPHPSVVRAAASA